MHKPKSSLDRISNVLCDKVKWKVKQKQKAKKKKQYWLKILPDARHTKVREEIWFILNYSVDVIGYVRKSKSRIFFHHHYYYFMCCSKKNKEEFFCNFNLIIKQKNKYI